MCNIKIIVTEKCVFFGKRYDTSSQLIEQHKNIESIVCEFGSRKSTNVFDLINFPDDIYLFPVDYAIPPWFNEDDTLEKAKEAFKEWCDNHVFVDQEIDELSSGFYCLKNCKVECLSGDVEIEDCQDCQIDVIQDESRIFWCINSQIGEMFDETSVINGAGSIFRYMYDKSIIHSFRYDGGGAVEYDFRSKT